MVPSFKCDVDSHFAISRAMLACIGVRMGDWLLMWAFLDALISARVMV